MLSKLYLLWFYDFQSNYLNHSINTFYKTNLSIKTNVLSRRFLFYDRLTIMVRIIYATQLTSVRAPLATLYRELPDTHTRSVYTLSVNTHTHTLSVYTLSVDTLQTLTHRSLRDYHAAESNGCVASDWLPYRAYNTLASGVRLRLVDWVDLSRRPTPTQRRTCWS